MVYKKRIGTKFLHPGLHALEYVSILNLYTTVFWVSYNEYILLLFWGFLQTQYQLVIQQLLNKVTNLQYTHL